MESVDRTEDDQIFSDTCSALTYFLSMVNVRSGVSHTGVDNVHGAHCAAGVVEDPFLVLVEVGDADLLV